MLRLVGLCLAALVAGAAIPAAAQNAPAGSCKLPDGSWCWPVATTIYGQPCECPGPNGTVIGITQ